MTLLGLIFAAGFLVGCFKGRKGLLTVLACAVPFNDSAMVALGDVTISPFYCGLMLYIAMSIHQIIPRRREKLEPSRAYGGGLLLVLFLYSSIVTFFGPRIFSGMGVIASGIGLDEQVGVLSSLAPSMSNLAQIAYMGLSLLLVFLNERERLLSTRLLFLAFAVGTITAFAAFVLRMAGISWPSEFFDNSPRGFYALPSNLRLRAQFSEPSHLGAFTVAASLFFTTAIFQTRDRAGKFVCFALAAIAITLLVASASGTAVIGGLVAVMAVAAVLITRALRPSTKISVNTILIFLGGIVALGLAAPRLIDLVTGLIDDKQDGISYQNRGLANQIALDVFTQSWGIGVGIGSNRASSLFYMLLSTLGVVGTLLFIVIALRCLRLNSTTSHMNPAILALVGCISASFLSVADLASPTLWVLIAATYRTSAIPGNTLSTVGQSTPPNGGSVFMRRADMSSTLSPRVFGS